MAEKYFLSKKRCVILMIIACCIYFMLNIVVWKMTLIVATIGALCTTAAFGLFLYFIKLISEEKDKGKANEEKNL